MPVAVIRLADRRPNVSAEQQEWAFQREVEAVLYGHGYSQQTGAVYRLLYNVLHAVRTIQGPGNIVILSDNTITQAAATRRHRRRRRRRREEKQKGKMVAATWICASMSSSILWSC